MRNRPASCTFRAERISQRTTTRLRRGANVGLRLVVTQRVWCSPSGLHGGADFDGPRSRLGGRVRRSVRVGQEHRGMGAATMGDDDDRPARG